MAAIQDRYSTNPGCADNTITIHRATRQAKRTAEEFQVFSLSRKKSRHLLGIDISPVCVRLLELSRQSDQYRIESCAVESVPDQVIADGRIQDTEAMGAVLERLLASTRTSCRQVAVALPDTVVMTKVVQMDASLSELDLEYQTGIEAGRHVSWSPEEMALDFEVLKPASQEGEADQEGKKSQEGRDAQNQKMEVFIAASRREHVDGYEAALSLAGLVPKVVDIQSLALERVWPLIEDKLELKAQDAPVAVINLELSAVRLHELQAGKVLYTREQPCEGLAKADDKERIDQLVQHSSRQLQLCSSSLSSVLSSDPACLVLTGSIAALPGLADALAQRTGIRCVLADPFAQMAVSGQVDKNLVMSEAPAMLTACGLALRSFE